MKKRNLVIIAVLAAVAFAAYWFFLREKITDTRNLGTGNSTNRLTLALLSKIKGQ